ncbi:hypothetical protein BDN72DRAFT_878424 [Pluteus cervinus]|uniref:Uncharacterized protein n=1 Tax=Pluteus cervinus TaxID=181527 RepID=A0ACD3AVT4_9AGAR|nr:hypothetical protein BDN72DRAFT_878424 [Pluteus cervinus]
MDRNELNRPLVTRSCTITPGPHKMTSRAGRRNTVGPPLSISSGSPTTQTASPNCPAQFPTKIKDVDPSTTTSSPDTSLTQSEFHTPPTSPPPSPSPLPSSPSSDFSFSDSNDLGSAGDSPYSQPEPNATSRSGSPLVILDSSEGTPGTTEGTQQSDGVRVGPDTPDQR